MEVSANLWCESASSVCMHLHVEVVLAARVLIRKASKMSFVEDDSCFIQKSDAFDV